MELAFAQIKEDTLSRNGLALGRLATYLKIYPALKISCYGSVKLRVESTSIASNTLGVLGAVSLRLKMS